jgi:hypothetical protein
MYIKISDKHISLYKASKSWKLETVYQKRNKYFHMHILTIVLVVVWNQGIIYDV